MNFLVSHFFTYTPFVALALLVLTFVRMSGLRVRAQAIWTMVLLLACSKFLCFEALGGNNFSPNLPAALVLGWDFLYTGAITLTGLSLLTVFWKSRKRVLVLPLIAWTVAAFGLWEGVRLPRVREVELAYPNLPAELDGYRIAQVSDIHCSCAARRWRTQAVVDLVNAQDADLVCLLGDYADGQSADRFADIEPIRGFHARDGVWAVTGNHEYYHDYAGWRAVFATLGLRFLENDCVFPRKSLALGGVNDPASYRVGAAGPDVATAFAAATNGEFRVLMQHQPALAPSNLTEHRVDLQLSGHTHGGIMPLLSRLVESHNSGFVRGVYDIGGRKLCISNGAGFWPGFPIRFFTPSEIVMVTLRKGT